MKKVNELKKRVSRPIKVMQIGEGNFLRAFVDYGIDVANEELEFNSNVAIIVPISGKPARFCQTGQHLYGLPARTERRQALQGRPYRDLCGKSAWCI